jgi:acyl carrier protein
MAPVTDVGTGIREALAARLKRDVAAIKPTDDLRNDLGLDSLDMIELLFKIEEVFDLEIPNEDLIKIATVGDVTAYVERRLADRAAAPTKTSAAARKPAGAPLVTLPAARAVATAAAVAATPAGRSKTPARGAARRAPARAKATPKRTAAKKKGA